MRRKQNNHLKTEPKTEQVYGNESFGIPADCTKKQSFGSVKLFFYILIVAVLCGTVYTGYRTAADRFLPEMSFDKSAQPVLYTKNQALMVKTKDTGKGTAAVNSKLYSRGNATRYTALTKDGSGLFYAVYNEENDTGFDLYFKKISAIHQEKTDTQGAVLIDRGVTSFLIQPDGQFAVYLKEDRLYFSDLQESNIIASDVVSFSLSKNNQQILYYKEEGKLFTCGTGEKDAPRLVDEDIEKVLSEKDEYAKIYYLKHGALWCKEYEKDTVCLAVGVKDGIMLGDYVYFIKEEMRQLRFSEVFADDLPETGSLALADFSSAEAARNMAEATKLRDALRAYYTENPLTRTELVLYTLKRNGMKELDDNLLLPVLRYYSCKQAIVYQRKTDPEVKIPVSRISSVAEAEQQAQAWLSATRTVSMQVLLKDKTPYTGLEEWSAGQKEISLDGKYIYALEEIDENGRGTLVRYTIAARELKNRKVLFTGVTDFAVDGADSSVVLAFDGDNLRVMQGNETYALSEKSCHDFFYVDGTLYFYDDYDKHTETGSLMRLRDGKVKLIAHGVHEFDARNLRCVSYLAHYNKEFDFGDLYIKDGNKRGKKVDICVRSILN